MSIVTSSSSFYSISCGISCTLVIDINRNVHSFGSNSNGKLGQNEKSNGSIQCIKNLYNIKMVSCGNNHSVCLDFDGKVFTFGQNRRNQLGIGKSSLLSTHIPQQITIPPIERIACGSTCTLCLTYDGFVYSFGYDTSGQLGHGQTTQLELPEKIPLLNDIEHIECGRNHVISKTLSNSYYVWGENVKSQLGLENTLQYDKPTLVPTSLWPDDIVDFKCGGSHSIFLSLQGFVYTCGSNNCGQLGCGLSSLKSYSIPTIIEEIPIIRRIESGYDSCYLIDTENNIWSFGWNKYGQLGLGEKKKDYIYSPTKVELVSNIMDISHGGVHTFVKTYNNEIYSFGDNDNNQLGIHTDLKEISTPRRVFKENEDIWCSNYGKSRQKSARK